MRLDDSNKIPLDYIFSYTFGGIYKISLNDEQCQKPLYSDYFRTDEVFISIFKNYIILLAPNKYLRNPLRLSDRLYLELYITKNYKNLIF